MSGLPGKATVGYSHAVFRYRYRGSSDWSHGLPDSDPFGRDSVNFDTLEL